jgi:hypothetical protein
MSAVLIQLSKERYWGLTEERRWSLGILSENYRRALLPLRVIRPDPSNEAGYSMPVNAGDEAVMRGLVEAVATGTLAYITPEDLRVKLQEAAR